MALTKLDTRTWGNTQDFKLDSSQNQQLQQLLWVSYNPAQPITWSFLFYAHLATEQLSAPYTLDVFFDVYTGVGRSQTSLLGFEHYGFDQTVFFAGGKQTVFSTSVIGAPRLMGAGQPANVINNIVGESIQVTPRASLVCGGGVAIVEGTIGAFFSPLAHFPLRELEELLSGEPSKDAQLRQLFAESQDDEDDAEVEVHRYGRRR